MVKIVYNAFEYSKTCVKRPLKNRQNKDFITNGSLMKVKCIVEYSCWSILQYFWPAQSNNLPWKTFFSFWEWPFYIGFIEYIMQQS